VNAARIQRAPHFKDRRNTPEWRELWRRLLAQYGYDLALAKFNLTDPEARSDLMAWRYLGGRR
jgi:hypothetical protein